MEGKRVWGEGRRQSEVKRERGLRAKYRAVAGALWAVWLLAGGAAAAGQAEKPKVTWTELPFAIVRLNEQPPFSWNIYHSTKKGQLLVRLWKRYLLVNLLEEEAFDIDPETITVRGNTALLSPSEARWRIRLPIRSAS